jgi:DNA modification methylase
LYLRGKERDELKIEAVQLATLIIDEKNARRHNERNIGEVIRSLETFGQHAPIVVQRGTNKILIGNGRVEAMRRMGWESCDVHFVDDDDATAVRRALADNRTAELGSWDVDILAELISDLDSLDIVGWSLDEIRELVSSQTEIDKADDDFDIDSALNDEPIVKRGEVWKLGHHRLMCGDSTLSEDVALLMDGEKAQIVFTDPPWNVDYGSDEKHPSWKSRTILNDHMSTEMFGEFLTKSINCIKSSVVLGAMVYMVMSAQEWGNLMNVMSGCGFHWSSTIIWAKDSLVLSRKDYHTRYEPIWYGWVDDNKRLCPLKDRTQDDVWEIPRPRRSEEHPTMKPIELVIRALENSSRLDDNVIDFFGGSGTTLIAAEKAKRRCFMMELDPKYCDVIIKRYAELKGSESDVYLVKDNERIQYKSVVIKNNT